MSIIDAVICNQELVNEIDTWFFNNFESFFSGENNKILFNNIRMLQCGGIINLEPCSPLHCVKWRERGITFYETVGDSISFEFQGCVMARICIDGKLYVAHIHCSNSSKPEEDTRSIWSNFIYANKNRISELIMFKPGHQYNRPYQNYPSVDNIFTWGVITSKGECYSLLIKYTSGKASLDSIYKHSTYGNDISSYDFLLNSDYSLFNIVSVKWDVFWQFRRTKLLFSNNHNV